MPPVLVGKAPLAVAVLMILVGCACNSAAAQPKPRASVEPVSQGLHCAAADHGLNVQQLGWGFCYPADWKYIQREVGTTSPQGVDTTLDIIGSKDGLFGFMIIGSYNRGSSASLREWLGANAPDDTDTQPIQWGNSKDAVAVNGQLKRYAMTAQRVYLMNIREGAGNLDLDHAMQERLGYWLFF